MVGYVHVGPFTFSVLTGPEVVEFFKGGDRDLGDCDKDNLTIRVSGEQAEGNARDTLWHEVLHAAVFASGLDADLTDKQEERVVRQLATQTLGIIRDNPQLIEYLTNG